VVLITRPGEAGQRLTAGLGALGQAALWWPAFDLLPPSEPQRVRDALARLHGFDLVVFVSPAAVRAVAEVLAGQTWPAGTCVAAVGGASLRAARAELPLGEDARVIGPPGSDAAEGGVEALWPVLASLPARPRNVLIVRAQSGRAWLGQQLRQAGAQVEELEAYRRVVHEPHASDWAGVRAALAGAPGALQGPAVLFSSTEAVDVLTRALQRERLGPELPGSLALCVHERIALAASAAGWRDVRRCEAEAGALLAALAAGARAGIPASMPMASGAGPDSVA